MRFPVLNCMESPVPWVEALAKNNQVVFYACNKSEGFERAGKAKYETNYLDVKEIQNAKEASYTVIMGLGLHIITQKSDANDRPIKYCKTEFKFGGNTQRQPTLMESGFFSNGENKKDDEDDLKRKAVVTHTFGESSSSEPKGILSKLHFENQKVKKGAKFENLYRIVAHVASRSVILAFLFQPITKLDQIDNQIISIAIHCALRHHCSSIQRPDIVPIFIFSQNKWFGVVINRDSAELIKVSKPVYKKDDEIFFLAHSNVHSETYTSEKSVISTEFRSIFGL